MSLFSRFVCYDNSYLFSKIHRENQIFQSIKSIQIFDKRAMMRRLVTCKYASVLKYYMSDILGVFVMIKNLAAIPSIEMVER